jgi:hypothetical protein
MEPTTFYQCCVIGSVGFIIMVWLLGQQRMRQVEGVMRKLAERHGASFKPGNLIDNPSILFQEGDLELRLYAALGGRNDPSHTELRLTLPGSANLDAASCLYLRSVSHGLLPRLVIHRGAKPYLTGEREFDEAFDVRGLPEPLLKRTLTADARRELLDLQHLRPTLRLARRRSLLPRITSRRPLRLHFLPPALQFSFYTAGLPTEINDWEPRLKAGRLLVANVLGRPLKMEVMEEEGS